MPRTVGIQIVFRYHVDNDNGTNKREEQEARERDRANWKNQMILTSRSIIQNGFSY